MTIILAYLALLFAGVGVWLSRQRLGSKPWLETGAPAVVAMPNGRMPWIGLFVLLAVVLALFALFGSAFVMRADYADWRQAPLPPIVWFNTGVLLAVSLLLQAAVLAETDGARRTASTYLAAGGIAALAFVGGQALAWRALATGGHPITGNPADSFFYLLTGIHALHVLGGLVALAAVAGGATRRRGLALTAAYWHALLLIWAGLLALFLGVADRIIDICGRIFA